MLNAITQRRVFERYLLDSDAKRLLRHVQQFAGVLARRDAAWMLLLSRVGLRVGSLAGLTVGDARDGLRTGTLPVRHAKGGHVYEVSLAHSAARTALRQLLAIHREMGAPNEPDAALIVSRNHQGMSVRSFQARMAHWVAAAGLPCKATPHWWRHTVAKRIMANSEDRDPQGVVQMVLGHRSRESTVIYTMPDREQIDAAMRCF